MLARLVGPVEWTPARQAGDRRFESGTGRSRRVGRTVRLRPAKPSTGSHPSRFDSCTLRGPQQGIAGICPCSSRDRALVYEARLVEVRILPGVLVQWRGSGWTRSASRKRVAPQGVRGSSPCLSAQAYRPDSSVVERRSYKAEVRGSTPRPGTVTVAQRQSTRLWPWRCPVRLRPVTPRARRRWRVGAGCNPVALC